MRFNNTNHRSLNESIAKVQNPQVALDEALEYTAMLEAVILDICEELEIDPDELMEMAFDNRTSASISRGNVQLAKKQEAAGKARKGFAAKVAAKHQAMKKSKTVYGVSDTDSDSDWAHRRLGGGEGSKPLRGKTGTGQVRLVRKVGSRAGGYGDA